MVSNLKLISVLKYYEHIDKKSLSDAIAIFHENSVYERGTQEKLVGLKEIEHFYYNRRVIADGTHNIKSISWNDSKIVVSGSFTGTLKSEENVSIEFTDYFEFDENKVKYRRTEFRGREV